MTWNVPTRASIDDVYAVLEEDFRMAPAYGIPWDLLNGKTILVTGAAGMVPAYLLDLLAYANDTILGGSMSLIGLVRSRDRGLERLSRLVARRDFTLIEQDVCVPLPREWRADLIVHGASPASPVAFTRDPVGTLTSNILGTYEVLRWATDQGVERFLLISSSEVYGVIPAEDQPITEETAGRLDSASREASYAEGKRAAEALCQAFSVQKRLPVTIARLFHSFGPGLRLNDGRVFGDFVAAAVRGTPIVIEGDGAARRSFCYLLDAAAGILITLLLGAEGRPYNIGNELNEVTIEAFAAAVSKAEFSRAGSVEVLGRRVKETRRMQIVRCCPSTSALRSLGWSPRVSLPDAIARTIRSFIAW